MMTKQISIQVNKDGVHMELSNRYHAEVLEHFIISKSFLERIGDDFDRDCNERIMKMFEFVNHTIYHGIETSFGDNDEGQVLNPYFDPVFNLYKSQLHTGRFFGKAGLVGAGELDFRNYLLFGEEFKVENGSNTHDDQIFMESGYAFFYDRKNKVKISFDFGNIGDHVSAAHGHSDLLHFNLEIDGYPILVDAGTYQYHSRHSSWRKYFRSAKAHNCILVKDADHAIQNNRMSWLGRPEIKLLNYSMGSDFVSVKARHEAYKENGVSIIREISWDKNKRRIEVLDSVEMSKGEQNLNFYLNFNPSCQLGRRNDVLDIQINNKVIHIHNPEFEKASIVSAVNSEEKLGWYSSEYMKIEPGKTVLFEDRPGDSKEYKTVISY